MSSDWFYHAPHEKKQGDVSSLPLMSQIPGLSDLPEQQESEQKLGVLIRDTDSQYIKLAKMGGRKNLLYFKAGEPSSQPKTYPVPEWWGAREDKVSHDNKPRAKHTIPDYMVHEAYIPANNDSSPSRSRNRVPFGQDGQSHWSRDFEGNTRAPNSNIVIQKQKRLLYPIEPRIRNVVDDRPAGLVVRPARAQTAKDRTSSPDRIFTPEMPIRMKTFIAARESEPTSMSKCLSFQYQREYLNEIKQSTKQDEEKKSKYRDNLKTVLSEKGYNVVDNNTKQSQDSADIMRRDGKRSSEETSALLKQFQLNKSQPKPWKTTSKTAHHGKPASCDNLYRMKRFENVRSRVSEVH